MNEKKNFNVKKFAIILIFLFVAIIIAIAFFVNENFKIGKKLFGNNNEEVAVVEKTEIQVQPTVRTAKNEYYLEDNNLSKFDLSFLKFENEKENKIYSPLSIKYAFKMLEKAATGEAKEQIASIIGDYELTKYKTNKNMAFANAFFVRDTFKDKIKTSYIDLIKDVYNAEIQFDSFSNANNINSWVKKNTLGLLDNLVSDDDVSSLEFALINALGIDMEWNHKFLEYQYEDDTSITESVGYKHENVYWYAFSQLYNLKFDDSKEASSMEVLATLNNYDIVKELGEDRIKEIVKEDFTNWAKTDPYNVAGDVDEFFENDFSDEGIEKAFEKYWNEGNYSYDYELEGKSEKGYLAEIKENYGKVDYTTDFSIYVDDNVKVFAKDLKESDGTTLQYIGIMPIKEDLNKFIENISETEIKDLIGKLKDLKLENFKDKVLTQIVGYIPKFKFDYNLNLQEDLEKMGVTDVFEQGKANLTEMTDDDSIFIAEAKHKANIEFTQDGIKASAATLGGGAGAGEFYNYIFDIPKDIIDISFNRPYMFLIRDKETGETWFVGSVYEPMDAEEEDGFITSTNDYYFE